MKILYLGSSPAPYQLDFWNEVKNTHSVQQIYLLKNIPIHNWEFTDQENISFVEYDYRNFRFRNLIGLYKLAKEVFFTDFDLIIIGGSRLAYIIALVISTIKRRKAIFWLERPIPANAFKEFIRVIYYRLLGMSVEGVFCIGKIAENYYSKFFKKSLNLPYSIRVKSIPHGDLNLEENKLNFFFLGQLIERKGIHLILDAFKNIESENINLFIAGIGSLESEVLHAVKHDRRISYLGYLNDSQKQQIFNKADIFIMPSVYDGWGVVLAEGISNGLFTIVTTRVGAMHDICDYNNHILVELNLKSIQKAIQECINKMHSIKKLRDSTRKNFLETNANSIIAANTLSKFIGANIDIQSK